MPVRLEAYLASGVLQADAAISGSAAAVLETLDSVPFERAVLVPLDGGTPQALGPGAILIDDLLLVVAGTAVAAPVHANWHELALRAGPYLVHGELPTLPGFDPGRALARPSGPFVLLRAVEVSVESAPEAGTNRHPFAWINRYDVDAVAADLNLVLFFPGASGARTEAGSSPPTLRV